MKQILTAMNNPKLNEELKKQKEIKVVGKDIQYKEGILEVLEKEKQINFILINEELEGEINLFYLLEKIKKINNKIKIVIIFNKENIKIKNKLKKLNIYYINLNKKIENKELIKIINEKILKKENINLNNNKNNIKLNNHKSEIKNKNDVKIRNKKKERKQKYLQKRKTKNFISLYQKAENREKKKESKMPKKVIAITGGKEGGKTTISLILSYYVSHNKYKVALLDGNNRNQDLLKSLRKNQKKSYQKKEEFCKINKYLYIFFHNQGNLEKSLEEKINEIKNKFDYIIIDTSIESKTIFQKVDLILVIIKPEIKYLKEIYFKYQKIFFLQKEKINILINNQKINSISSKIISKIFNQKIIPIKIKNNLKIEQIKNNFYKNKEILNNKIIKNKFIIIIKKILNLKLIKK